MESIPASSAAVAVAINPVALVVTECITVTSAMRKHARWAHSSVSAILGGSAITRLDTPKPALSPRPPGGKGEKSTPGSGGNPQDEFGVAVRWGLRGKKGQSMQDNPLLAAFARLRSTLKGCKEIHNIEAPAILNPFLQVIRSSSTSAPITSLALIAITKFFAYNIISLESPQLPLGMQMLSSAVTHCRFEASDSATDEVVLFRILKLMEGMVTGPCGDVLADESICEMMETGISMCCQVRLSELLRRSAEVSMVTMCQTIFQRLKSIEVATEEPLSRTETAEEEAEGVKMEPSIDGDLLAAQRVTTENPRDNESLDQPRDKGGGSDATLVNGTSSQVDLRTVAENEEMAEIKPYSLPSIRELFRVLVGLLDPHDRQHNDTMRVMALRIVDVAFEVAGPSISNHPSLAALAKDTLCRHLFQLVRSENIAILNESLRVAGTLLSTCRKVLKLQQELYLSYLVTCLHPRVEIPQEHGIDPALYEGVPQAPRLARPPPSQTSSGRSTPVPVRDRQKLGMEGGLRKPDAREAMVENIGALVRIPSFMAELFINYDCEIDRSDLCVDMVGLLSRNAFPDAATWSTTNVPPLCLDALLGYIQSLAERLDEPPDTADYPSRAALQEQRALKKVITKGATKFNESPKAGLAFLASKGIIDDVENPRSVANFLRGTTRIDKAVLGDFLTKKSNEALLSAFLDTFDFTGLRVDEALRKMLNSFRLPGEALLIQRVVEEFSQRYFTNVEPEDCANQDSIFVLTFAIIMLNTDQHNPSIKQSKRMQFEDFTKNLRGQNGGKDFAPEYLENIFNSIKTKEIILAEEHDNKYSFDHAWKELLAKIQFTSDLHICDTNIFDADMFAATWRPVVATLTYVFMSATDDTVFSRVVTGFDQCAQIAAKYELHEAIDQIIFCLSSISTLSTTTLPSTSLNTEVQAGEKVVMVSETAVRFGRDFKAQLATVVLFRVVTGQETAIREGWSHLVRILLNLFVNSLISEPYASVSNSNDLSQIPLQSPAQVIERTEKTSEGGLFSAFTSYVSSFANDEPPEPSDQEIEYTLCTVDCINSCALENFFSNLSTLPLESLKAFVTALLEHIPEESSPRVMVVKPDLPAPSPIRPNGQRRKSIGLSYDPSLVFILEFTTLLVARDSTTIEGLGKEVARALQGILRDAEHIHHVTLSRTIYYLLSFLRASHDHDLVRPPVVVHMISKIDDELLKQAATFTVKGLSLCLNGPPGLRSEIATTPDFWLLLRSLLAVPEMPEDIFTIVQSLADSSSSALTADNYEPAMALLNEYANAGSVGAMEEQKREQAGRRGRPIEKSAAPSEDVVRGQKALQIVYHITNRVPSFVQQSQLEPFQAWITYWTPVFRTLSNHSLNPCRQIRSQALSSLQRVLLSPVILGPEGSSVGGQKEEGRVGYQKTIALFMDVLFPLIDQLLKPEVWHSDPGGMGDTRLQASLLCCKVFLGFLDTVLDPSSSAYLATMQAEPSAPAVENAAGTSQPLTADGEEGSSDKASLPEGQRESNEIKRKPQIDGARLWATILQNMERLIKSGGGHADGMEDAVPESLKNIMLVMSNGGYLVPPSQFSDNKALARIQKRLWYVTSQRVNRFLPGLLESVFPELDKEELQNKAASPRTPAGEQEHKRLELTTAAREPAGEADEAAARASGEEKQTKEERADE